MRLLDRYIISSIIKIFIATVVVFCVLYMIIDITNQLDEFIDRKVPIMIILQYYQYFFPIILVQTSSFACLIAVLFTFSGLNNNNEIVAMRASGLSFWKVTRPALYFGLFMSVAVFWLSEQYVPLATQRTKEIREEHMILLIDRIGRKQNKIKNLTFYGLKNRLYFVDSYHPGNTVLEGITIIEYDNDQNIKQKIVALKGVWTGIAWKFYQCQVTTYLNGQINRPDKIKVYAEKLMDIKETPNDFLRQRINVNSMNIKELGQYIHRFSNSGARRALNNLKVDYHQKIAYPFGNFVVILLGLPFVLLVKNRKGMTFVSFGTAVGIAFFFYVSNSVAIAFGKGAILPPILAAWAVPIIFVGVAITIIEYNF